MRREKRALGARRGWLRAAAASLAALVAAAALAATGAAQGDPAGELPSDPGQAVQEATGVPFADTGYTPVAKDGRASWRLVAGTPFGAGRALSDSPTPFTSDLNAVAFRDGSNGLAAGSDAIECDGKTVQVPVIYRYGVVGATEPFWHEAWHGTCGGGPGFVGAVAWIADSGQALAVGGDGRYPDREPGTAVGSPGYEDPAGGARAWHYDGVEWRELEDLPKDMGGLTALDFDPRDEERFGYAGGLAQLWQWKDGGFAGEPTVPVLAPELFRFRVRDLRFVPGGGRQAFAATAGCCAADDLENTPRVLAFDGVTNTWRVTRIGYGRLDAGARNYRQDMPDSFYSVTATRLNAGQTFTPDFSRSTDMFALSVVATPGGTEQDREQSFVTQPYCVYETGASESDRTLPSGIDELDPAAEALRRELGSARLVAGDGDGEKSGSLPLDWAAPLSGSPDRYTRGDPRAAETTGRCSEDADTPGDGVPDWAVGELRGVRSEHGTRGVVLGTATRPRLRPDVLADPDPENPTAYERPDQEDLEEVTRSQYFAVDSYALRDVAFPPGGGDGWAVGAHGAIVRYGVASGSTALGRTTQMPELGEREPEPGPDLAAYDALRPLTVAEPGRVPPLDAQAHRQLDRPRLEPAGSPDPVARETGFVPDVRKIVMSRDGSEGWAVGPSDEAETTPGSNDRQELGPTLIHYARGRWTPCDAEGIPGHVPADPACSRIAGLWNYTVGGQRTGVWIKAAARVPLENDDDPANDDELELVAAGNDYSEDGGPPRPVMLRYRDGRWDFEADPARAAVRPDDGGRLEVRELAFTAPDDGWLLIDHNSSDYRIFHFDGERWVDCAVDRAACGDDPAAPRLPVALRGSASGDFVRGMTAAGDRVYLFGYRDWDQRRYPMVVYRDRGGRWSADPADGGLDPAFGGPDPAAEQGEVEGLGAVERADGKLEGWAFGKFGGTVVRHPLEPDPRYVQPAAVALHLRDGRWEPFRQEGGPLEDYLTEDNLRGSRSQLEASGRRTDRVPSERIVLVPPSDGGGDSEAYAAQSATGRLFAYDPGEGRWSIVEPRRAFDADPYSGGGGAEGPAQALAPDGAGGLWMSVKNQGPTYWGGRGAQLYFYRLTDRPPAPVFTEAPGPADGTAARYTGMAADAAGRVWISTASDVLYRYDRLTGWSRLRVPGWDPGRLVTRASQANAIAVAPDGTGIVVGEAGRIADLAPGGVVLDAAAGRACATAGPTGPCGTPENLRAAAVAPDGSALAAGDRLALLWRPAGAGFRPIAPPPTRPSAAITGAAMPAPGQAWIALDTGEVYAGRLEADPGRTEGERWRWELENVDGARRVLAGGAGRVRLALRAIAVDRDGRGFAVGDQGLVLERAPGRAQPWRRVATGRLDHLTAVALPAGGGEGALVGGRNGLILTLAGDELRTAREGDFFGHLTSAHRETTGPVAGLALVPGTDAGDVEAWAALQGRGASPTDIGRSDANQGHDAVLHYASGGDPLLDPGLRARPLPDVPAAAAGDLSFAAFGDTGCVSMPTKVCPDPGATLADNEVVMERVVEELRGRAARPDGPKLAVLSGDMAGDTSLPGSERANDPVGGSDVNLGGPTKLRRWRERVSDRLAEAGLPLYAAIGGKDLSGATACMPGWAPPGSGCTTPPELTPPGTNLIWRQAFADAPAPWGRGPIPEDGGLEIAPVATTGQAFEGEASTHYAFDVERGGKPLARFVFADTSLRTLTAGEAVQNPAEPQALWLRDVLAGRPPGSRAVVVSNTPAYTYGPGSLSDTLGDAAQFEETMLSGDVSAVVSGRLGWNGLYWTLAPGLHHPCPGGDYPAEPPRSAGGCDAAPEQVDPDAAAAELGAALRGAGAPGSDVPGVGRMFPTVVAASAGAAFGPDKRADGEPRQGYWHGYTIVRLPAPGSERPLLVEQRPVLDWIQIRADERTLRPGQRLTLRGFGREPVGRARSSETAAYPLRQVQRFDRIDSAAITHRYDLVLADRGRPYLPLEDANGDYVPVPARIATVDGVTGALRAGRGVGERTYAVALLSVGDKVATYPLAFEPRRSFTAQRPKIALPPIPRAARAPAAAQPVRAPEPPPPPPAQPPASPPTPLQTQVLQAPQPPAVPTLPSASAPAPPAPPSLATPPLPAAPAPPAPPPGSTPVPLGLSAKPATIALVPGVNPPSPPPVNPAPPGGSAARKEAKQRQAAAAKSEDAASESADAAGDFTEGGAKNSQDGLAATRRSPERPLPAVRRAADRPAPSFTPLGRAEPASAWARGALYGGGLGLAALAFAAAWLTGRPTDRRRLRSHPAPARAEAWRRR
jgi:hypothetical protein